MPGLDTDELDVDNERADSTGSSAECPVFDGYELRLSLSLFPTRTQQCVHPSGGVPFEVRVVLPSRSVVQFATPTVGIHEGFTAPLNARLRGGQASGDSFVLESGEYSFVVQHPCASNDGCASNDPNKKISNGFAYTTITPLEVPPGGFHTQVAPGYAFTWQSERASDSMYFLPIRGDAEDGTFIWPTSLVLSGHSRVGASIMQYFPADDAWVSIATPWKVKDTHAGYDLTYFDVQPDRKYAVLGPMGNVFELKLVVDRD